MKYRDLPKHPKPGVALWCPSCDATFSADRADYLRGPDEHITCHLCHLRLRLIRKVVRYVLISAKKAEAS